MVIKMDKYSFVIYHKELPDFLLKLQEIGIVDITRENKAIDDKSRELYSTTTRYSKILSDFSQLKESLSGIEITKRAIEELNSLTPIELLSKAESLLLDKKQLEEEIEENEKELIESKVWGKLDEENIKKIEKLGYTLHLYSVSEKKYNPDWEKEYPIQILKRENKSVYFILLNDKSTNPTFPIDESKFPKKSYDVTERIVAEKRKREQRSRELFAALIKKEELFTSAMEETKYQLDLHLASLSSVSEAEGTLALLTGFAPKESRQIVKNSLENEGAYFLIDEAKEEDNPPIKLKNGFFARLFEPIGELYMLPKYGELDLTRYFAPFYMLFFGLCLGDIGYGLTILVVASIAKLKAPKYKAYLSLLQFLGIGAILMASLSGGFFGTNIADIIPLPDSITQLFFSNLTSFWFAILFGIFQIVFARLLNAFYLIINKGWQYGIHNIGWAILIVWVTWAYASTMTDITLPPFMNYLAIAGVFMVLFFSSQSGNIFVRFFKGITAFYDVTSIFGDTLSYIRLFGLGTSGAILGMVVNSLALSMSGIPYVGWPLTIVVLIIGHIFVLLLSSLGAFVHPMRLTFVEFYGNAGFEGGGRAYSPLSKVNK